MKAVPVLVACGLVAAVLLSIEAGRRLGILRQSRQGTSLQPLHPAVENVIFGLMGLLVSFTFYGAGTRFEARRSLVVREANAISTTYLRLDLLPKEMQPELRDDFRNYLRSRLVAFEQFPDVQAVKAALNRSTLLQENLWKKTVEAAKTAGPAEKSLVLSSLNETIDITTDSTVALTTHPPTPILIMLVLTVIVCSALAGYGMSASRTRDWVSTSCFVLVVGIALYMTFDYEFPRIGLIRIDPVDQVLAEKLDQMK